MVYVNVAIVFVACLHLLLPFFTVLYSTLLLLVSFHLSCQNLLMLMCVYLLVKTMLKIRTFVMLFTVALETVSVMQ